MTREEALEQLNLTEHSSTQLIRKRYLELHDDYEKAIAEAPSDHFKQLYRANLDKIEEAYLLMRENPTELAPDGKEPQDLSPDLLERIQGIKQTVQSFVRFKQENPNATPEQQEELKAKVAGCISVISGLQQELASEGSARDELNAVVDDLISINETTSSDNVVERPTVSKSAEHHEIIEPPIFEPYESENIEVPELEQDSIEETSDLELHKRNSKILIGLLSSILILGLGGLAYLYLPMLKNATSNIKPEETIPGEEQSLDRFSVLKIVGDEFYRVDNYVEALIQYTMALSIKSDDLYLQQMIDSCRLHLSVEQIQIVDERLNDEPSTKPPVQTAKPIISINRTGDQLTQNEQNNYGITSPDLENGFVENSSQPANREAIGQNDLPEVILSSPAEQPPEDLISKNSEILADLEPKRSGGVAKESEFKEEKVYNRLDINPVPIEGYERFTRYLARNMEYPKRASIRGTTGVVIVQMVILKDGTITNLEVKKQLGNGCDEEALRVIQAYPGKWKPGIKNGVEVNSRVAIPITFKLK
ncbi:MAG: energy transducer TonB [Cyclobacteriaceae bacterium]